MQSQSGWAADVMRMSYYFEKSPTESLRELKKNLKTISIVAAVWCKNADT